MENKKLNTTILTILAVVLLSSIVSAFSLGCLYHSEKPLELSPGETKEVFISLQASAGAETTVRGNIIKGSQILRFKDPSDTYVIPAGGEKGVYLIATMPSIAQPGDTYGAEVSFTTVTESSTGSFTLGSSIVRKFDVVATPKITEELPEEKIGITLILIILIVVVIIIIIIVLLLKRKKRR